MLTFYQKPASLKDTIPHLNEPRNWNGANPVGACEHKDYSISNQATGFWAGRALFGRTERKKPEAGSFINFNGTAGVWRKKFVFRIPEVGHADTLTEDLDLKLSGANEGLEI